MGLMQLLTVGRSLGTVPKGPNRFRPAEQGLLPKFGSPKEPESRTTETPAPPPPPMTAPQPAREEVKAPAKPGVLKMFLSPFQRRKAMNTVEAAPPTDAAPAPAKANPSFPLGRWTLFANPFNKTKTPPVEAGPVQGELLLDLVKPVRNDLRDSDLEVVAAPKPAPMPAASVFAPTRSNLEATSRAAEEAEPIEPVWNRLKNQWFGHGQP